MSKEKFFYRHISFQRFGTAPWVYAKGEVTNTSFRSYHTAVFRITMFNKEVSVWNGVLKIRNFKKMQTKFFETFMIGMDYKLLPKITKYEIYFERGY